MRKQLLGIGDEKNDLFLPSKFHEKAQNNLGILIGLTPKSHAYYHTIKLYMHTKKNSLFI